jgi:indole-3-glycerol phosphate synthase
VSYLDEIGAWSKGEVVRRRETRSLGAAFAPGRLGVIAEFKRSSPSEGPIAPDADPVEVALRYAEGGAAALSILTCGKDFGGSYGDLERVRAAVDLPILAKDFFVDTWQVIEARTHGADAILVIMSLVEDDLASDLLQQAEDLEMDVLVEVHDEGDLHRALELGAPIIGINARNLATLAVDAAEQRRLIRAVPKGYVIVAESGIGSATDATRAREAGASGVLVGTALMRRPELLGELQRA